MASGGHGFPIEDFVQSLTSQLDKAQDALALKATTGRPLTFALKDLNVDLSVFWEVNNDGKLLMRHAQPNESGASTVHFSFTTITRAMVEENTLSLGLEEDPRSLNELGGAAVFNDNDRRRLEMVGVRTVGQFKRMSQSSSPKQIEAFLGIPVDRLRVALQRSSQPAIVDNEVIRQPDKKHLLRIRGANLLKDKPPKVRVSGRAAEVLHASESEILVQPLSLHQDGEFEVEVDQHSVKGFYHASDVAAEKQELAEINDPYATGPREVA